MGSLLLDLDYEKIANCVKIPDETFRDKIFKIIEENVTTMKWELGKILS